MDSFRQFYIHLLKNAYDFEHKVCDIYSGLIFTLEDSKLKVLFQNYAEDSKTHLKRLESVCEDLNTDVDGGNCKPVKHLLFNLQKISDNHNNKPHQQRELLLAVQRILHFKISIYGHSCNYAKELNFKDLINRLDRTIEDTFVADEELMSTLSHVSDKRFI